MALKIGRVGQDIALREPQQVTYNGDELTIQGDFITTSYLDTAAQRQQIIGHARSDQPIPVTWGADPHIDGYYLVKGVTVGADTISASRYRMPYSVQLQRVDQYAAPQWETVSLGTNRGTYISGYDFTAFGSSVGTLLGSWATYASAGSIATDGTTRTRVTEDGTAYYWVNTNSGAWDYSYTHGVLPAAFYVGAPRLELAYDGTNYRIAVGDEIENLPTLWRLTNGLVRCTFSGGTSNFDVDMQVYDGSQWDTARTFRITQSNGAYTPRSISVIRNDADSIRIRLPVIIGTGSPLGYTLDVVLRRGARVVDFFWGGGANTSIGNNSSVRVQRTSAEASTAMANAGTYGFRATSNDASGNRFVVVSSGSVSPDLTNGTMVILGSQSTADFGIGYEMGGSGAANIDAAARIASEHMGAYGHTFRYVGN